MRHNFLVADRSQHVTHSLRQLVKRHHVFVISQVQIKSNALSHVIGEPPTGITGFISRPRERSMQPIAAKLEELSRVCAEIRKFFLKRDHDSCSGCCVILAWNSGRPQVEIIPAEAHWVLHDVPMYEWHPQIDRRPEIAGTRRRNANTPPHRSPGVFRVLSRRLPTKELRAHRFPLRAQSRPQYPPA